MKRIPSLHITETKLALVLKKVLEVDEQVIVVDYEALAQAIVSAGNKFTKVGRSIVITNAKLERKANQILTADKADAILVASLLHKKRLTLKHRGAKKLTQDHRDWVHIKKLTSCCIDFCNDFNLEKRGGFIQYINICMAKITSTSRLVDKMVNMYEGVAKHYEAVLEIQDDTNSTETREVHDIYCSLIHKNTGLNPNYKDNPTVYTHFIQVRKVTDELDIPLEIYITAQFEGLAWANSYPEPPQLVGEKAIKRLNKYMYENKIKKAVNPEKVKSKDLGSALQNIKRNGKNRNRNK